MGFSYSGGIFKFWHGPRWHDAWFTQPQKFTPLKYRVTSLARIFNKFSWLVGGYCSCPSARARNYLQQELPRTQVANGSSTKPLGTKNTNCSPRFIQIAMATGHDRLGVGFIHACHKLLMKEVYNGDGDVVRESLSGIVKKSFVLICLSAVIEPRPGQSRDSGVV